MLLEFIGISAAIHLSDGKPVSVLSPHAAATPRTIMNITPTNLPDVSLLLQPWSTATSHMTKNTIAMTPSALIHILHSPNDSKLPRLQGSGKYPHHHCE